MKVAALKENEHIGIFNVVDDAPIDLVVKDQMSTFHGAVVVPEKTDLILWGYTVCIRQASAGFLLYEYSFY